MVDGAIDNVYTFQPSEDPPTSLVVLLHGLGSNGQDLVSLAPYWAASLPGSVFVSPDAPYICDMVPEGYEGAYQWFSLQDRDPAAIAAGIKDSAPALRDFIGQQLDLYELGAENLALVGFSQGTMMSLYAGPRYPGPIAGVLGYSGALYTGDEDELKNAHKIPIHLIHGEADDVVPCESWSAAKLALSAAGFPFSGETTLGLAHNIDESGIQSGGNFLNSVLSP